MSSGCNRSDASDRIYSKYSWIIFYCVCKPHFIYSFIWWWRLWFILCFGYYEQRCCKPGAGTSLSQCAHCPLRFHQQCFRATPFSTLSVCGVLCVLDNSHFWVVRVIFHGSIDLTFDVVFSYIFLTNFFCCCCYFENCLFRSFAHLLTRMV